MGSFELPDLSMLQTGSSTSRRLRDQVNANRRQKEQEQLTHAINIVHNRQRVVIVEDQTAPQRSDSVDETNGEHVVINIPEPFFTGPGSRRKDLYNTNTGVTLEKGAVRAVAGFFCVIIILVFFMALLVLRWSNKTDEKISINE